MKTRNILKASVALLLSSAAVPALAAPLFVDLAGTGVAGTDDGVTEAFNTIGGTTIVLTSIYHDANKNGVLDLSEGVLDTNRNSVLASYLPGGDGYYCGDGTKVAAGYNCVTGGNTTALNPNAAPVFMEGVLEFGDQLLTEIKPLSALAGDDVEGVGSSWGFLLQYAGTGTVGSLLAGSPFTGGDIELQLFSGGSGTQVTNVDITGSALQPGNLVVDGDLIDTPNYDDFLNFAACTDNNDLSTCAYNTGDSFGDLLAGGNGITQRFDTNVDPSDINTGDFIKFVDGAGEHYYIRQTDGNVAITFDPAPVPVPAPLALMAVGLMGLGLKKKFQKA